LQHPLARVSGHRRRVGLDGSPSKSTAAGNAGWRRRVALAWPLAGPSAVHGQTARLGAHRPALRHAQATLRVFTQRPVAMPGTNRLPSPAMATLAKMPTYSDWRDGAELVGETQGGREGAVPIRLIDHGADSVRAERCLGRIPVPDAGQSGRAAADAHRVPWTRTALTRWCPFCLADGDIRPAKARMFRVRSRWSRNPGLSRE
jgi:hypothetical protein